VPDGNIAPGDTPKGIDVIEVRTVGEALDALM